MPHSLPKAGEQPNFSVDRLLSPIGTVKGTITGVEGLVYRQDICIAHAGTPKIGAAMGTIEPLRWSINRFLIYFISGIEGGAPFTKYYGYSIHETGRRCYFRMNPIGWGLLLDLYFWIAVASAILFFGVWACIELIIGSQEKYMKFIRAVSSRETSPHPSPSDEDDEEQQYWNPS